MTTFHYVDYRHLLREESAWRYAKNKKVSCSATDDALCSKRELHGQLGSNHLLQTTEPPPDVLSTSDFLHAALGCHELLGKKKTGEAAEGRRGDKGAHPYVPP